MRLPDDVAKHILSGRSLGFACTTDGEVTEGFEKGWGGSPYPPPGFLSWNILEVGNGDVYGYYWPIGKENEPPIVCTTMHDAWQLEPVSSTLAACLRLALLRGYGDGEEIMKTAQDFGVEIARLPTQRHTGHDEEGASDDVDGGTAPSLGDMLKVDPDSPHLRMAAAREAVARRDAASAKTHLNAALSKLPEYSEAWMMLAQVCRQQQDLRGTAIALMEAITSPLCFGAWERRKLLGSLQRLDKTVIRDMDDPLWDRCIELTFAEGVKENSDYRILEELVEEYHQKGMGRRAVRLRVLVGEMMRRETVSFRERNAWTGDGFRRSLRLDVERAGLPGRLPAI